ncbi:aldose epimerase family protein [Fodinibius halophilus]|uniref:Aldose 1-epimerase n=1 Tax=Fodinibius halophilus TaxID=1736908 RepID=A0A6M1T0Q9_9BACT|nr:aldose epimerase family protein [Fodinibius halophilus]NGP89066.1 galactose mutarotase [Fodinibius halophilus]
MNICDKSFRKNIDGKEVRLFKLVNNQHMRVLLTNYGGRIVSWLAADKDGRFDDIVLGFNNIEQYMEAAEQYHGAIIGRYSNRIANGTFSLNGRQYQLEKGNNKNHLHGGGGGFHNTIWKSCEYNSNKVVLKYISQDGEQGYPGRLEVFVEYRLTEKNELHIIYRAKTDRPTIVNLTNHTFFNLSGTTTSINNHQLRINADQYTPVDESLIPTGKIESVDDTPFDFRRSKTIGRDLDIQNPQLAYGGGYDHNFVLNKEDGQQLTKAAKVVDPQSGRFLEVETTEPGLQFYGGNHLDGSDIGKKDIPYNSCTGFCLEPQHFPDSPNQPAFPSVVLKPDSTYNSRSVYRLGVCNSPKS